MDYNIVLPSHTKVVSEEGQKGIYEISKLYPGYGNTLGNSLRRILLSSIPGAAITKVKINGVSHEFSTLPGIKEDIMKLLLNLKQLRFKLHGDEGQIALLEAKGQKDVVGKDVKCPTQLEVMNKNQHILSLTDKSAKISMELRVERGIGFVPSEELAGGKVAVGDMVLDAVFTPIRRANYEVENMRVGDRTDFNLLRLTVETDGTISPREAFQTAVSVMKKQIEKIETFDTGKEDYAADESKEKNNKFDENSVDLLKLSQRTKNALLGAGINSISELSGKSADEILSMEGVGEKAVTEIKKVLKGFGLSLRE